MSLSIRLFSHTIYFLFLIPVYLSQVKVHQSKGIPRGSFLLRDAPGRRIQRRSYNSKVTLQSHFPGYKYLLTMCPPREKTVTFLPLHTGPDSRFEAVAQVESHQKKRYEQPFRRRTGRQNSLCFNTTVKKVVLNNMASL